MLDGFDDDFELPTRRPRPRLVEHITRAAASHAGTHVRSLAEDVQIWTMTHNAAQLRTALHQVEAFAAAPGDAAVWVATAAASLSMALAIVEARFFDVLDSDAGRALLGGLSEDELAVYVCEAMSTHVAVAARRCVRWVFNGPADSFLDAPGSTDTLAHHRALQACLVSLACVLAYAQSAFTGPEHAPEQVRGRYPVQMLVSAMRARWGDDATRAAVDEAVREDASSTEVPAWRRAEGETSIAQMDTHAEAGAVDGAADAAQDPVDGVASSELQPASNGAASCPSVRSLALAALSTCGEDAYVRLPMAHMLACGRMLTHALCYTHTRTLWGDGDKAGARPAAWDVAVADLRRLALLTRELFLCHVVAGRASLLHVRALVDVRIHKHPAFREEIAAAYHAAAALVCPEYKAAFTTEDVFQLQLVAREVAATGFAGDRAALVAARQPTAERGTPDPEDAWLFDETTSSSEAPAPEAATLPAAVPAPCFERTPEETDVVVRLLLEWGNAEHFLGLQAAAKTCFFLAKRETGLLTLLTGALGRRTKFQQYDLAQLVLRARSIGTQAEAAVEQAAVAECLGAAHGRFSASAVRSTAVAPEAGSTDASAAPPSREESSVLGGIKAITLSEADAATELLETVAFRDPALANVVTEDDKKRDELWYRGGKQSVVFGSVAERSEELAAAALDAPGTPVIEDGPLSILDQCVVLALCLDIRNHSPADGLTQEEMRPYIDRVLDTPLDWMVYSTGLLVKCWLEFENYKTQERAVLQLQALVDQHSNRLTVMQSSQRVIDESAPASARLSHLFCTAFPPAWDLKRQCADRYRKMMVVRSALQLYEELQLWEDVIDCYVVMDQTRRAEKLLRERLRVAPSPRLWCVLGTVTNSDEPFLTAWELSNHTFGKAKLALGRRFIDRGDVAGGIAALEEGLQASPLNEPEWFLLGALYMRSRKFPEALAAFGRVVALDPTRADAWANMGSIHLHERDWERGYFTLEQALRADRKDWRMWSNFLVACCQTRHFSRAIHVMHRLVDMRHADPERNDGVDESCLAAVVDAVLRSCAFQASQSAAAAAAPTTDTLPIQSASFADAIPPAPVDVDAEPEESSSAAASNMSTRDVTDAGGTSASTYMPGLAKLLGHITAAVTKRPRVWLLYARIQDARGRPADALDCRQKACRAYQTAGWEKDESIVEALAAASKLLVQDFLRQGTAAAVTQAKYHVNTLIARIEAAQVQTGSAGMAQLRQLQTELAAVSAGAVPSHASI